MGSGVAGALRSAAGDELNDEAVSKGPIDLGEVAVTDAYDLDVRKSRRDFRSPSEIFDF